MPTDLAKLEVSRLKQGDDLTAFTSTDSDRDDFLKVFALTYQEENVGVSFLARLGSELIGFFTISAAWIRVKRVEPRDQVQELEEMEYYPALLIGQLAVDKRFEKQGVGKMLLQTIYGIAVQLQERIGIRFLLLSATPTSLSWWTARGFIALRDQEDRRLPFLYLDVRKMER